MKPSSGPSPALRQPVSEARAPGEALPRRPVEQLTRPLQQFLHLQAAGGLVLLGATVIALIAANSAWADAYRAVWETHLQLRIGGLELDYPLWYWVNDALMTVFFFVIGLEIKREMVWGELRDRRNVVLPAAAALGGAVVPVGIYLALQNAPVARDGWAIPMATDIAFVVGALALLGPRVPTGLKIFMLSLAIIDDILAVGVIALAFTETIHWNWLGGAAGGIGVIVALNRVGVRRVGAYVVCGSLVWLCTLKSGVHPTVAGALLGLLTPASAWIGSATLVEVTERALARLHHGKADSDADRRAAAQDLSFAASESVAPLERLEHTLHPWVGFVIMPVFALANAAVTVSLSGILEPVAVAVALGLLVGKPLGITLASWLMVRLGLGRLPQGTSWAALLGAACLGGIGFTMALFIASLSLSGGMLDAAKSGILTGSAISMVLGMTLLVLALPRRAAEARGHA